jgi:hypothetical protein
MSAWYSGRTILLVGFVVADDTDDVHQTRAYGSERFLMRYVPIAALLLLLGLFVGPPRNWPLMGPPVRLALTVGSFAYIVFACWRRFVAPGRPRLVLSTQGIDQRLSHGHILHIPWHEVQDVVSIDHTVVTIRGFRHTTRDVPAVVVSAAFYAREMPHKPWLRRPLNWGHFAEAENETVKIVFRHDYLGTRAPDLRQAIETRWRAFSRHPNAKLPPSPESIGVRRRSWLPRWVFPAVLLLCALPALYIIWTDVLVEEMSDGTRSYYLGDLLDKTGVTARLADGQMARLRRADVAQVGIPRCETTRDRSRTWFRLEITAAVCTAPISLPSGARAVAVFRLVTETQTVEYKLGAFREDHFRVTAPLSLEEADALLCRLGHCGPDAAKR